MPPSAEPSWLERPDGIRLAYHPSPGSGPGVVFLGGFMSDMTGTKATALEAFCQSVGRAFVRFDYRGHGRSGGRFVDGTIGAWRDDALAILDHVAKGPQVLVGSSMGGWLMLLAALARPQQVVGLVGIAPAPDFVVRMWAEAPEDVKRELQETGQWQRPSQYSAEPYTITRNLLEEGRRHLLLDRPVPLSCPVRLLHGMRDPDVPWRLSLELAEKLASRDVAVTLVKDGDHRLSEPDDIARLLHTVESLAGSLPVG